MKNTIPSQYFHLIFSEWPYRYPCSVVLFVWAAGRPPIGERSLPPCGHRSVFVVTDVKGK